MDDIKIDIRSIGKKQVPVISPTELYRVLSPKTRYMRWIKRRLLSGRFINGVDYKRSRDRLDDDGYYCSLECARSICMLEKTDKGMDIRSSLFEFERRFKDKSINVSLNLKNAVGAFNELLLIAKVMGLSDHVAMASCVSKVEEWFDIDLTFLLNKSPIMDSIEVFPEYLMVSEIGKRIGTKGKDVNKFLERLGWLKYRKVDKEWIPTQLAMSNGICIWRMFKGANSKYMGKNLKWNYSLFLQEYSRLSGGKNNE